MNKLPKKEKVKRNILAMRKAGANQCYKIRTGPAGSTENRSGL